MSQAELDQLWQRVEDARLRWKFARQSANEVHEERFSDVMPSADGSYAHIHALRAQRLAVEEYLRALQDFKAALALEKGPSAETPNNGHQPDTLTHREREVLKLIVSGKSSKQVAAELGIAFRTATCHRQRIYRKLHVHTNVELTRAAMRMGLIEL